MKRKLKMMALSAVLAAGMLLPTDATAQFSKNENFFKSDGGYFRSGSTSGSISNEAYWHYSSDIINEAYGSSYGGISNESYGAPLGSGLLIMLAAGAGYIAIKRRRSE